MTCRWSQPSGRRTQKLCQLLRAQAGSSGSTSPGRRRGRRGTARPSSRRALDDLRQALQLLAADRRLDVGHAVVVAERGVRLEDDLLRAVPLRVSGTLMPCCRSRRNCASQSASVVVTMPPSPVVMTLRGWKEKQATSPCGLADPLPAAVPADLAADGAGGVFDDAAARGAGERQDRREVARHARSGARRGWPACAA